MNLTYRRSHFNVLCFVAKPGKGGRLMHFDFLSCILWHKQMREVLYGAAAINRQLLNRVPRNEKGDCIGKESSETLQKLNWTEHPTPPLTLT